MVFKIFKKFTDLKYGLSEKADGSMKLAAARFSQGKNRENFFKSLGIEPRRLAIPVQAHSGRAVLVAKDELGKPIAAADGLAATLRNVFLTITVADCFPVYFFDQKKGRVGLAHCGWRGAVGNLAASVARVMGSDPADILVGIGPGIGPCHFEIKKDILSRFSAYPEAVVRRQDKIFVDLPGIIKQQLVKTGLSAEHIENSGECTFEDEKKYFSFRRDKPELIQAMVAYIGLT